MGSAIGVGATASVELPIVSLLLMALVVALGYGISMTSLAEDIGIIQQLVGLRRV